jgi:zinc/manganese transport system substrate-binding protein
MLLLTLLLPLSVGLAACGGSVGTSNGSGKLQVVAAENFWGSIARQLGGERVDVRSIIVNPNTDPHSYEPTASDGTALASSQLAIVNGVGYDGWAPKLLAANPAPRRTLLTVGDLLGLKPGKNPHQWYSPRSVTRVIDAIAAAYQRLDPGHASYFAAQKQRFETQDLADYNRLRGEIHNRYAGVPVGYSENIFEPLGTDLGLKLLTPASFAKAIAEGTDVNAQDKQTVDRQISGRKIKVWVLNSQNTTPDVQRLTSAAKANGIPVAAITETLTPASASFEQWQVAQLQGLLRALAQATGR